ncbi:DUF4012 domain-containing protein [Frankia nepalensis]|nr:DUF4012 domain-containing protein [Frankia nepalensis]
MRARIRRPTRRVLLGLACAFVFVLAVAGWLGVRGLLAYQELTRARADIADLQDRLLAGDVPAKAELAAQVDRIAQRTRTARDLTGDPVWSAVGALPGIGCPLKSAHALVAAVERVAGDGLPAMAEAAGLLNPESLRSGTTIVLPALAAGGPPVGRATTAVETFRTALADVDDCGWRGAPLRLGSTRATVAAQTDRLAGSLAGLKLATELGPPMLGAHGETRRYLLVVQNPAEARANGGIVGGYGLLTARDGVLRLDDISGNGSLPVPREGSALRRDPGLSPELAERYGSYEPSRVWPNANLTPDYPTVGRFYAGMYAAGTGVEVDGTISVDPTALSYLLAATRPATLPDGQVVTADRLVKLVSSDVYALIDGVQARDEYFADVGKAVYEAVISGDGNTRALLTALGRSAGEGRLLVSSTHADEQRILSTTALGGALPTAPGPFLGVLTQNATGGKLDYWLHRAVGYRMERAKDGSGVATIVIQLFNAAPAGLPEYVRYRLEGGGPPGNPDAVNDTWLSVYTGVDSRLLGAALDGKPIPLTAETEREHTVLSTFVPLARDRPRTLVLRVWEPIGGPELTVRGQPLANPERIAVVGLPTRTPWQLIDSD